MNLTQIIHKLEEECREIAHKLFMEATINNNALMSMVNIVDKLIEDRTNQYDKNQSIITILSKIDEGKIATTIHKTKTWQCLHLEVVSEILDDVKKRLAKSLTNYLGGGE